MEAATLLQNAGQEVLDLFGQANPYRTILILIISIAFAYYVSKVIAKLIVYVAQKVAVRSDTESREDRVVILRQVETYLSVSIAVMRVIVVAIVAYVLWRLLAPTGSADLGGSGAAAIGASAFFIVIAGQTLGILLRDITAGATMIIEKWFKIGDYIKVEPFLDMTGVVERMTLRSTKLRSLSGEVIWIHNQQIQAVHVTPQALRTMAVDIFVHDRVAAEKAIDKLIKAVPTGPTMLARPLRVKYAERWGDDLWRITVVGQTAPGREWLIEKYFVNALIALDDGKKKADKLLTYEPIARFADPIADSKFKRAVRVKKDK